MRGKTLQSGDVFSPPPLWGPCMSTQRPFLSWESHGSGKLCPSQQATALSCKVLEWSQNWEAEDKNFPKVNARLGAGR